ncbi:MAG: hypothetical protein AB7F99_05710 [Vicinamibacterales bacterium]
MFPRATAWLALGLLTAAVPSATAEVRLSIGDGRVSLVATDATLGEILAEWERVGSTRIENGDRVSGPPMTLRLDDMPESEALGILLRALNGYIAVSRQGASNGSQFDRIMIMPGQPRPRPSARAGAAPAAPFTPPAAIDPAFEPPEDEPEDDPEPDSDRPVRTVPPPASRGAVFGAFPQPQATPPPDARTPAAGQAPAEQSPQGVSVPGMIVPAPQDDQQPPQRP